MQEIWPPGCRRWHFSLWSAATRPHPSSWLVASSVADPGIALTLAGCGWLMQPLPIRMLAGLLAGANIFAFGVDLVKVPVFPRLKIA
jgi:H+-transporting ATPase